MGRPDRGNGDDEGKEGRETWADRVDRRAKATSFFPEHSVETRNN